MKKNLFFAVIIAGLGCCKLSAQPALYGVTPNGGSAGSGTLFKFSYTTNTLEIKKNFDYSSDGGNPVGKLLYASNGLLYGTTQAGGIYGYGTLFEYDPSLDVFTKKADFDWLSGAYSYGHLIQLPNGDIIGTSYIGGANGYGTIWKFDIASSTITKLYDFDYNSTGAYPTNGLTLASNGKLYGLNWLGGQYDNGTLFEFDMLTNILTVKIDFNYSNGSLPLGKLKESNGKLLGVTYRGGNYGIGTLFEYDLMSSSLVTRYSFDGVANGAYPYAGLNKAANGLFYGTNTSGGLAGNGVIFSFDQLSGNVNKVHDFDGSTDGNPENSVMQASDGKLYGLTNNGSSYYGLIYKYDIGTEAFSALQHFDDVTTGSNPFWTELTEVGGNNTDPCGSFVTNSTAGTINCNGGTTTVNVSATGGTAPYTGTGSFIVNAGTHSYTVTDSKGCTSTTNITIAEPSVLVAASTAGTINCNGGTTTVSVSASGGTAPYTGTGNFTVTAGPHLYTVTDANGCTSTITITVTEPTALVAASTAGTINCNGGSTTVNISASGGTAPYTGTGSFTANAGTHSYTVTDANGCTSITNITIAEPSVLVASSTAGMINCNGGTTTVNISASGGTAPYTGTGNFTANAGAHAYTITDANGCTSTTNITIAEPSVLVAASTAGTINCNGGTTTVNVSASGGTAPYTGIGNFVVTAGVHSYTITDANGCTSTTNITIAEPSVLVAASTAGTINCNGGTTAVNVSVSGGTAPYTGTGSFTVTSAGTYSYTVIDSKGCTASTIIKVTLTSDPLVGTISVTKAACSGSKNWKATATVTGGCLPYTYSWATSPVQSGPTATGLSAGSYTVKITSANGMSITAKATITQPVALSVPTPVKTNILCNGEKATATSNPSGGNAPYSYAWSTLPVQTAKMATGLAAANYTVTVTDANGCTNKASVSITQPTALLVPTPAKTSILCNGGTATATSNPSGGTSPYVYSWSTSPVQATKTATGLQAGAYAVKVTDANGCNTSASVTITQPAPLTASAGPNKTVYYGYSPGACATLCGTATGGIAPYKYAWSTGAATANISVCPSTGKQYTLIVTDANGCTASDVVKVCVVDVRSGCEVAICHKNSNGTSVTMSVSASLVPGHLAHGDNLGKCGSVISCVDAAKMGGGGEEANLMLGDEINLIAYPNPFYNGTAVRFNTVEAGNVEVFVYNMLGIKVATLFNGMVNGLEIHEERFNAEALPNGVYFVKLFTEQGDVKVERMLLNR